MDNSMKLSIEERIKGSKGAMKQLRRDGALPGSVSRRGDASVSFSVNKADFTKAFKELGMSGIYTLQAGRKKPFTAMIREIQYVPGSYDPLHVTLQAVSMTEETTADIHLHIHGRDELQRSNYELLQQLESLHIKGLPGDFPPAINIDVTKMKPGDHVTVADIKLPEGLTSLTEPDRLVLSVAHPKVHAAETAEDEAADEAAASDEGGAEGGDDKE